MIYTLIVFVILLTFTIEPKYLGKLKLLSLQNITSKTNVQTIRHGLLIAFLLWLVYYLFHKEINSFFQTKESMTGTKSLDSVEISDNDKLSSRIISFWNFAKGDNNQKIYFPGHAGGNNNAKIVENEGLVLSSAADWAETNFITKTLSGSKSLVAWATITDNDGSRGGAPISIFQDQTEHFDAIVWAERENNKWMVGSNHFKRTRPPITPVPKSPINTKQCIVMTQDYSGDNIVIKLYIDGEKVDEYTSPNKTTYEANTWRIYFGPRHTNQGRTSRSGHFIGTIHAAGLFDKALTEDEVKQLPSLLDTLTEIEIGSSSTNPKEVSLPENVTYVDNMPYNEQNPVWKDTFENTIDTTNKTLSVKRTDNDGNHSGWGQNLVFKGYAKDIINDTQFNSESVKYGEPVNLHLTDGVTEQPIPLVKISYSGTKTPAPTELNGNDIVKITDANNENKILVMGKDRFLTMIDKTSEPKPEYDTDQFLLKPEVGELSEKEYKEKISKNPINYGDKIAIAIVTQRQRNILYNGCGWFGCRVLKPNSGYFSHGGKNRDTVPYTTLSQGSTNNMMQTTESVGESVKYGQPVNLELIDGKTKQPVPSLKILNANDKTSTSDATYTKVMFADAENENKMLVMGKDRFITMIDTTSQPKPEYQYDTFNILPDFNVNGNPVKPANSPIKFGDKIAISVEKRNGFTGNCGWFGCRVLKPSTGYFSHGGKDKDKVPYTTIEPTTTEPTKPDTLKPTKTETKQIVTNEINNPPLSSLGTFGSGTLPVPPEDTILQTQAASGPDYETSHGSMINHPELTKGLTTDKVTPKPVYYEPGTIKYSGLGYVPSYSEMIYLNNYPFESKPKELHEGNPHGFCSTKDNVLNNIEEKCNGLPTNVCSTTDCCVLVGGTHCVEGDEKGPKNKVIYSDTNIKNRDVYYYKGDCYGNCK